MRGPGGPACAVLVLLTTLLGCAASDAREGDQQVIAFLRSVVDDDHDAFLDELRQHGIHVGRDVRVLPDDPDDVFADVEDARRALLSWHERDPLSLVVAFSTPYAQLAIEELPDVPTVFVVNDPVAGGLVTDPDTPDRGATGVSFWTPADRTLHLGSRVVGGIERLGYLAPAGDPAVPGHRSGVVDAAAALDIEVVEANFEGDASSIDEAAAQLAEADVDAAWLANANTTYLHLPDLEVALERHAIPTLANIDHASFAVVIITPDGEELRRQVGRQAVRVLDGAPTSSIPVEPPRRFVLEINRTQARALGLPELDEALLRQADLVR